MRYPTAHTQAVQRLSRFSRATFYPESRHTKWCDDSRMKSYIFALLGWWLSSIAYLKFGCLFARFIPVQWCIDSRMNNYILTLLSWLLSAIAHPNFVLVLSTIYFCVSATDHVFAH